MRGWASYLKLLGGRGGLTPAGIGLVVSVTFSLTMLSGWGPYSDPHYEGHFLPAMLGHALVAVVALLLWWLLFFLPASSPPAPVTLGLFVALAIVRIYAIDYAYFVVGGPTLAVTPARMALSIVLTVPLFAVAGMLGELMQQSRRARRRIDEAEESILSLGGPGHAGDSPTVAEVMSRAQAHIDQLLLPWKVSPPTRPEVAALEIDALVEEVIRPLSHETKRSPGHDVVSDTRLDQTSPLASVWEAQDDPDTILPQDLRWREIVPTRGEPLLVLSLPIVVVFMWERFGWSVETLIAVSTLPFLWAAFWMLRRAVIRLQPRTAFARFVWIVACLGAAGSTTTMLMVVVARALGTPVDFVFAAPVLLAFLGTGASIAEHLVAVTLKREDVRARTLTALAARTARDHGGTREAMVKAADLLHSGVQAELVAWAALFRSEDFDPNDLPEAIEEMGRRLDTLFHGQHAPVSATAQSRFDSLTTVWSAARPIEHTVEPGVWQLLDDDPELADQLFLVFSEALSNAVRHGRPGDIAVDISQPAPDTLLMTVSNPGVLHRLVSSAARGMGLTTIEEHSRDSQLEQQGGRVVLSVWFTAHSSSQQQMTHPPVKETAPHHQQRT